MNTPRFTESLEARRLFATIDVVNHGAIANDGVSDQNAIQAAINASATGDTIRFGAGTFDITKITLKGSRTYLGLTGATLRSNQEFAVSPAADTSNITITGLRFQGAGIGLGAGSSFSNIRITKNIFDDIPQQAIKLTVRSDGISIDHNTFINVRGYGAVEAYTLTRFSYSYNRLIDCSHGGHFLAPLLDCKFNYNRITGAKKMGLEIQRNSAGTSVSQNMQVIGNVVYDWKQPTNGAMALSVIAEGGINTRIADNYLRSSIATGSDWDPAPGGPTRQFGPSIESGFDSGVIENNTSGGPQTVVVHIAVSGQNTLVRNNRMYGSPSYGPDKWVARWPGITGYGTFTEQNNLKDTNRANMPAIPRVTGDANNDGIANNADFAIVSANFGKTGMTYSTGDFSQDGIVNSADFAILAGNFGGVV